MAAPYGEARRRRGSVIGPLILIFIGAVFLLQNAGILPPTVWTNLWRLWPVILVIVGLELLFGARAGWLVGILGLGAIGVALATMAGANLGFNTGRGQLTAQTFRTDASGANQASVTVRFGAGQLELAPLADAQSGQLALMTYDGPSDLMVQPSYSVVGGTGRLEYQLSGRGTPNFSPFNAGTADTPRVRIDLAPAVPIATLVVQTGAADARVDLSSLHVNNVDMAIGAAATRVRLPETGITNVHISGGASTINLDVPNGVAARIRHRGGLSTLTVNQSRFPSAGEDLYQSSDWDTNPNKADISLETGVTTIQVN